MMQTMMTIEGGTSAAKRRATCTQRWRAVAVGFCDRRERSSRVIVA